MVILRFIGPVGDAKGTWDGWPSLPRWSDVVSNIASDKAPLATTLRLPTLLAFGMIFYCIYGIANSLPWYITALLMASPVVVFALIIGLFLACMMLPESHRSREFRRIPGVQATRKPLSARDFAAACDPPVPAALVNRVREALAANDGCRFSMRKITIDPARIRPDDGLVPPTRLRPTSDQIKKFCNNLEEMFEVPISPEEFRRARTVSGVVRLVAGQLDASQHGIPP